MSGPYNLMAPVTTVMKFLAGEQTADDHEREALTYHFTELRWSRIIITTLPCHDILLDIFVGFLVNF